MWIQILLWGTVTVGFLAGCWAHWSGLKPTGRMFWLMAWTSFVAVMVLWAARN